MSEVSNVTNVARSSTHPVGTELCESYVNYFIWWLSRALFIQPKLPKISVRNQMERTILVRTDRNIWNHLGRWSTLTGMVISVGQTEMSFSI